MDEMVQFLRDRLDEDERTARRAGDSFRQIGGTGIIVATEGDRAEECASANWAGIAEQIVRHDPARVLAEVEAKRELLRQYAHLKYDVMPDDLTGVWALEATLRAFALPHADHPAFQPEWRP